MCPFCDAGPFKIVAGHTQRIHDIDRYELREAAGLVRKAVVSDPDWHLQRSAIAKALYAEGKCGIIERNPEWSRKKRTLSPAGIEVQRAKSARARELHPGLPRLASETAQANWAARMAPLHEQVLATYETVVKETGRKYGAIKETARRLGWTEAATRHRLRRTTDSQQDGCVSDRE